MVWPERLQDVIEWSVYERSSGDSYGGHEKPAFIALSYSWNRFVTGNWEQAEVKNVPWSVPEVRHFSHAQLKDVIRSTARLANARFCWVDVFCLEQSPDHPLGDEIHRQAQIFSSATQTFLWLSQTSSASLFHLGEQRAVRRGLTDESPTIEDLVSLGAALAGVVCDPWFSSLWTLQEAGPRSIIVSKEGVFIDCNPMTCPKGFPENGKPNRPACARVLDFAGLCHYARRFLQAAGVLLGTDSMSSVQQKTADELLRSLFRARLFHEDIHNPNVLYKLAQTRTAPRIEHILRYIEQDIYALPASGCKDLEELHLRILCAKPVQSQLFIRPWPDKTRPSWSLSTEVQVPNAPFLTDWLRQLESGAIVTHETRSSARVSATACTLQNFMDLLEAGKSAKDAPVTLASVWLDNLNGCCMVDEMMTDQEEISGTKTPYEDCQPTTQHVMHDALRALHATSASTVNGSSSHEHESSPLRLIYLSRAHAAERASEQLCIGLIVEHLEGKTYWARRGLCFWRQKPNAGLRWSRDSEAEGDSGEDGSWRVAQHIEMRDEPFG